MFHRRFIHFDFSFNEKLKNKPQFESDLVLNFAMCSFINLRDRVHDPVIVPLIALKKFSILTVQSSFPRKAIIIL